MTCGFGSTSKPISPEGAAKATLGSRAYRLPAPPRGNAEYDESSRMLFMSCVYDRRVPTSQARQAEHVITKQLTRSDNQR